MQKKLLIVLFTVIGIGVVVVIGAAYLASGMRPSFLSQNPQYVDYYGPCMICGDSAPGVEHSPHTIYAKVLAVHPISLDILGARDQITGWKLGIVDLGNDEWMIDKKYRSAFEGLRPGDFVKLDGERQADTSGAELAMYSVFTNIISASSSQQLNASVSLSPETLAYFDLEDKTFTLYSTGRLIEQYNTHRLNPDTYVGFVMEPVAEVLLSPDELARVKKDIEAIAADSQFATRARTSEWSVALVSQNRYLTLSAADREQLSVAALLLNIAKYADKDISVHPYVLRYGTKQHVEKWPYSDIISLHAIDMKGMTDSPLSGKLRNGEFGDLVPDKAFFIAYPATTTYFSEGDMIYVANLNCDADYGRSECLRVYSIFDSPRILVNWPAELGVKLSSISGTSSSAEVSPESYKKNFNLWKETLNPSGFGFVPTVYYREGNELYTDVVIDRKK